MRKEKDPFLAGVSQRPCSRKWPIPAPPPCLPPDLASGVSWAFVPWLLELPGGQNQSWPCPVLPRHREEAGGWGAGRAEEVLRVGARPSACAEARRGQGEAREGDHLRPVGGNRGVFQSVSPSKQWACTASRGTAVCPGHSPSRPPLRLVTRRTQSTGGSPSSGLGASFPMKVVSVLANGRSWKSLGKIPVLGCSQAWREDKGRAGASNALGHTRGCRVDKAGAGSGHLGGDRGARPLLTLHRWLTSPALTPTHIQGWVWMVCSLCSRCGA